MVAGRIVEGSPREIAEKITQMVGDRRVSVLLMDETMAPLNDSPPMTNAEIAQALADFEDLAVSAPHADDSREAIYTQMDGE